MCLTLGASIAEVSPPVGPPNVNRPHFLTRVVILQIVSAFPTGERETVDANIRRLTSSPFSWRFVHRKRCVGTKAVPCSCRLYRRMA